MGYINVNVDVDIDTDDVLGDISSSDLIAVLRKRGKSYEASNTKDVLIEVLELHARADVDDICAKVRELC